MRIEYTNSQFEGIIKTHNPPKYPNWRFRITLNGDKIVILEENFDMGFNDGEWWDKIHTNESGKYVTYITKDRNKINDELKQRVIESFHKMMTSLVNEKEEYIKKEFKIQNKWLGQYKDCLQSDLFKSKIRDEKIDEILNNE